MEKSDFFYNIYTNKKIKDMNEHLKEYEHPKWKMMSYQYIQEIGPVCERCGFHNNGFTHNGLNLHHMFYYQNEPVYSDYYKVNDFRVYCSECHEHWHYCNETKYKDKDSKIVVFSTNKK